MADVKKVHLNTVVAIEANGEIITRKNLLRAIAEFFEQMKQKRIFHLGDGGHIAHFCFTPSGHRFDFRLSQYIVVEMIPVVAPHALQRRKQIVAFVGTTPMLAKGGSNNLVSSGTYQFT